MGWNRLNWNHMFIYHLLFAYQEYELSQNMRHTAQCLSKVWPNHPEKFEWNGNLIVEIYGRMSQRECTKVGMVGCPSWTNKDKADGGILLILFLIDAGLIVLHVRNRTVLCWTWTRYLAARPSRTLDPDLGVTVKHSFPLLFSKDILYSFNTFGHLGLLGALGLLITFPVLG